MRAIELSALFQPLRGLPSLSPLDAALAVTSQTQQDAAPAPQVTEDQDWFSSGFFLRLGFSFIVGLAVGYALKVAFKISLVIGGLLLVLIFSLQYSGIIEVNWSGMETNYNSFVDWLSAYASGLKDFMADNLSNAASFSAGLLLGLRL